MSKTIIAKGDKSYLGKKVTVKMDRPIGTVHPKHPEIIYPINYGYIEGLVAGDGEEQDVYILGINEPIDEAEVTIIALIERINDNEDKWVGVPNELVGTELCYECNINQQVHFQEQFYNSICDAVYEKACGAVMYTEFDGQRKYLIIENESGHIGFPKGHVEYGETEIETVIREVFEETALKAVPEQDFRMEYSYLNKLEHQKTAVYYLSHYEYASPTIQQEEINNSWLLTFDEAMEKLNSDYDRIILEAAEKHLK